MDWGFREAPRTAIERGLKRQSRLVAPPPLFLEGFLLEADVFEAPAPGSLFRVATAFSLGEKGEDYSAPKEGTEGGAPGRGGHVLRKRRRVPG